MSIIYLKAYLGAFLMFCIMDGLWLGVLATDFYFNSLEGMLLEEPNWPSAIVFYLGYTEEKPTVFSLVDCPVLLCTSVCHRL